MTRHPLSLHRLLLFTALVGLLVVRLSVGANSAHAAPLSDAHKQVFSQMQEDPEATELIRNSHYWVSNENVHDIYRDRIQNLGGILTGVGTDQLYLLAGWARPEVIIPMDFDGSIRDIHFAYGAAFLESADIATFRSFWQSDAEDKMRAAVQKHFGEARVERTMQAWKQGASRIHRRFNRVVPRYRELRIPTFVTDQSTYAFLRTLWQEGRVYPLRGDITADRAMVSIGQAAKQADMIVRVVYLSNVEQYVEYTPSLRRNFIDLPMDEKSVILRTRPMKSLGLAEEGCEYHYNMQDGLNFQQWLKVNRVPNGSSLLLRNLARTRRDGLSEIRRDPPVSDEAPTIAPSRR